MSTYPTSPRSAFLEWCQTHEDVFVTHATAIGLTVAQASAFKSDTDKALGANLGQAKAKEAAFVATQTIDACIATLKATAGDTIRSIRAFAEQQADPLTVYNTAQIPPPATPTPVPPPAQPTNLTVTLDSATGAMTLRWKATNPPSGGGTAYIIKRKLPTQSDFAFIGVSGKKEFVDDTLIAGPDYVQYTVQGQRADVAGPVSPVFTVNFGQAPDGFATASVTSGNGVGESVDRMSDRGVVEAIVNSKPHANGKRMTARK